MLIPVILLVSFIVYWLADLAPGDFVDNMVSAEMTKEDIAALKAQYDLDKPMIYRYGKYMWNLLHGDLGVSVLSNKSVWQTYKSKFPNTIKLTLVGMILGLIVAIPLGIYCARHAGGITDNLATIVVIFGISMPSFWLALLMLQWFSFKLGWLPTSGMGHGIKSFVLPGICSALMLMASATRQTRSSMLEVLRADYLRTARAKGVPEREVIHKHAFKNALIPIITVTGTALSYSLAGSVAIETVFAWPGVGRMAVEGVSMRDTPTVIGSVILTSIVYVVIQILVDIAYAFVDPSIRAQYTTNRKKKKAAAALASASAEEA
jgi:peptide/nickel transport system permease protein